MNQSKLIKALIDNPKFQEDLVYSISNLFANKDECEWVKIEDYESYNNWNNKKTELKPIDYFARQIARRMFKMFEDRMSELMSDHTTKITNRVTSTLDEWNTRIVKSIESEGFIDNVVDRIMKKQLIIKGE